MSKPTSEISEPDMPGMDEATFEIVPIGWVRTPWIRLSDCPRNPGESNALAEIDIFENYRDGLASLETVSHVILIYWLDRANREMLRVRPPVDEREHGVFATRAPVRPNPLGVSIAELVGLDAAKGQLIVRGVDCLSGTPLIDIKPYFASTDARPNASVGWHNTRKHPSIRRGWDLPGAEEDGAGI